MENSVTLHGFMHMYWFKKSLESDLLNEKYVKEIHWILKLSGLFQGSLSSLIHVLLLEI